MTPAELFLYIRVLTAFMQTEAGDRDMLQVYFMLVFVYLIHVFISIFFTLFSVCDNNAALYQLVDEMRLQPVMSVCGDIASLTLFLDLHLLLSHLKHSR